MCVLCYLFYMATSYQGFWLTFTMKLRCSQVNLVDWLKMMVGSRRSEEVVDPNIEVKPSTRALKRALLTALRCVDPDSEKRPKMSQVVRMLESEEYPLPREVCFSHIAMNSWFKLSNLFFLIFSVVSASLYFHEYTQSCFVYFPFPVLGNK